MASISKKLVLHYPNNLTEQPVIYKLVKDYDLIFNILRAQVSPDKEGLLVMELTGEKKNVEEGIKYLHSLGIKTQPLY